MRSLSLLAGVSALILFAGAARSEEPHLDLIRGLRAAGEPGLAMEYLEKVAAGKPSPELATVLPLERARTRLELALQESEEGKRVSLLAQARSEFDAFLKTNAQHPLAPQANFEIARLIASQAKEQLTRANRQEDAAQQQKGKDQARTLFEEAAKRLEAAGTQLQQSLAKYENPTTPEDRAVAKELSQAALQAQLEQGVNLFLISQTYKANLDKNKAVDRAMKVLQKLADGDSKNPMTWVGRAWLARCEAETQDYPKATEKYDLIAKEKGPHVEQAQRIAAYFRVRMLVSQGVATSQIQSELENWLNRYRAYHNTPEGFGAKFLLAFTLQNQAKSGIVVDEKTNKLKSVTATAENYLVRASALYKDLIDVENEFTERATNQRMLCILGIAFRRARDRDVSKLNTFDECYLIALVELAELNQIAADKNKNEPGGDEVDLEKERKTRHERVIRAIERALTLVKPTDLPKDILDARLLLLFSHLVVGNNHQAAILGEHLARSLTRSSRGANAALYSLQAYVNVMGKTATKQDVEEEDREKELQADRRQIRRLAEFMEKTWPNDGPTDFARYQLANLAGREGNYVEALTAYARVSPNFTNLAYVRNEQAIACFNLMKDEKVAPAVKNQWFQKISAELEKMPDLAAGAADPETAQAYCMAKLQLGHLYLNQKQSAKAEAIAKAMLAQLPKYGILAGTPQETETKYAAQALQIYALYTQVYDLVQAGDHVQAAKVYLPFIDQLKKDKIPADDSAERVRQAIRSLLQLTLRSSVQEGQIPRAQEMLELLKQASAGQGAATGPLVAVLRDVQAQITAMRRKDPNKLKDMVDKFAAFLGDLEKQKDLSSDVKIFLARGYMSLEKADKATALLKSIPPPDAKADDEKKRTYNFVQLSLVRSLRGEARALLPPRKERNDKSKMAPCLAKVDEARKLLAQMIGTPDKKGWAFNSLEVRRENIFILEDMEQYQPALQAWSQMQKPFADKLKQVPANKEEAAIRTAYFEIRFYQYRLVYRSNLQNPNQKVGLERIKGLAENIVKIEKDEYTKDFGGLSVQRLYEEWIESDEIIRKAYKEAGGVALIPADERTASTQTTGNR